MSTFELAQKYYLRLWDKSRLKVPVQAERLTEAEFLELTGDTGDSAMTAVRP